MKGNLQTCVHVFEREERMWIVVETMWWDPKTSTAWRRGSWANYKPCRGATELFLGHSSDELLPIHWALPARLCCAFDIRGLCGGNERLASCDTTREQKLRQFISISYF